MAWLLPSLALTLAASLYNTMVPVTAGGPGASPTDHRLTGLHAANRVETASAIMPKFYYCSHFISDYYSLGFNTLSPAVLPPTLKPITAALLWL